MEQVSKYDFEINTINGEFLKGIYKQFQIYAFNDHQDKNGNDFDIFLTSFFQNYKILALGYIPENDSIICCEDKCLLIHNANKELLFKTFKQSKAILIDIDEDTNDYISQSIQKLYSYAFTFNPNNELINVTLKTLITFIIRRNFYPSNCFKDSAFFSFTNQTNHDTNKFEDLINQNNFYTNLMAYSIPQPEQNLPLTNFIEFNKEDFIDLVPINDSDILVFHFDTKRLLIKKNSLLSNENHPYFVHAYGQIKNELSFIYEFYSNGSLTDFCQKQIDIETIFTILCRISSCAKYAHSKSLLLDFDNIYVDHDLNCFVSLAKNEKIQNLISIDFGIISDLIPEIVKQSKINFSDDIYLFGFILVKLLSSIQNINSATLELLERINHLNIFVNNSITHSNSSQNSMSLSRKVVNSKINSKSAIEFIRIILKLFVNIYHQARFEYYQNHDNFYQLGQMYQNGQFVERSYQKAKEFYEKALPNSDAYVALGMIYFNGIGQTFDFKKAFEYFSIAAESNNHLAYFNLGEMYSHAKYVQLNYQKAIEYYHKAHDSESFYKLGIMYSNGQGVDKNFDKAIEYFEKSNSENALYNLGLIYDKVFKQPEKAIKYFESSALLGNSDALLQLGDISTQSHRMDKAIEYYEMSCKKRNSQAMLKLGLIYLETDKNKAFSLFLQSSKLGNFASFYQLGLCYLNGWGTKQNYEQALKYFQISADNGISNSFVSLGLMYMNGIGIEKDYQRAKSFFVDAATKNNLEAIDYLGEIYFYGLGIPKNISKAQQYFELSKSIKASLYLGKIYSKSDTNKAVEYYTHAMAYYKLGLLFLENDKEKSEEYFQLAIKNSDSNGYIGLGKLYRDINLDKSIEYFTLASKMNNPKAFEYLGDIFMVRDITKSIEYYKQGSMKLTMNQKLSATDKRNKSSIKCQLALGNLYYNQNQFDLAKKYYDIASCHNNKESQFKLGLMYFNGIGVAKNIQKAQAYFEQSNTSDSLYYLGLIYLNIHKLPNQAKNYLLSSSKNKNDKAALKLGNIYVQEKNYQKAFEIFSSADNNESALLNLALMYSLGLGAPQNYQKAFELFSKLSALGNSNGDLGLGHVYFFGNGKEVDYQKAHEFYSRSASKNNDDAFYQLGIIYANGFGVPIDYHKAEDYFAKSAELGNFDAYNKLGNLSMRFEKHQLAFDYYLKSAEKDNDDAILALGYLSSNGIGTEFDYRKGIKYLEEAANRKNHEANMIWNKLFEDKNAQFPIPRTMTND